jgi:carbamoyl-phosphate synthase small subunit
MELGGMVLLHPKHQSTWLPLIMALKKNILRCLSSAGCRVTGIALATVLQRMCLEYNPDGIFLSNGPGDPAATGSYAVPEIQKLVG